MKIKRFLHDFENKNEGFWGWGALCLSKVVIHLFCFFYFLFVFVLFALTFRPLKKINSSLKL